MLRSTLITAAVVLVVGCSPPVDTGSASAQDRQAILAVIHDGMVAERTAFIPTPAVCPGPVPASVREQLLSQIPIRLGAYFTSPQLEKEIGIGTGVVNEPTNGAACLYGAGVDWVRMDRVSTSGASAVAAGQIRIWASLAQWHASGPSMAEPHGTLDVNFDLRRVGGKWLISHYDWRFAPGSEP
ncbi:MAG TPA: hypothetical protein VFB69_01885 [Candidatus Dormibacteraeota bacterium]|nr:hypothetical protein [Candidatus Dormibacteraeota bacterium]